MEQKILTELQRLLDEVRERKEAGEEYFANMWWNYFCTCRSFAERITGNIYEVRRWKVEVSA